MNKLSKLLNNKHRRIILSFLRQNSMSLLYAQMKICIHGETSETGGEVGNNKRI